MTQGFLKCVLQGFSVTLFLVGTEIATVSKLLSGRARSVCSVGKPLSEDTFVNDNEIPFSSIHSFASTLEMVDHMV